MRIKLVTCAIAAAVVLAACGSDSGDSSTSSGSGSSSAPAESSSGGSSALVKPTATDLGEILANSDGMTVYGFMKDTPGTSNCVDACSQAWPPVTVDGTTLPDGLDSAIFTVIARPDGTHQLQAGDWPLYTFASDSAPGDTTGQGTGGQWFVVTPDGQLDKNAAPAASATTGSTMQSGSGY